MIEVTPLETKADRRAFVALPGQIAAGDPHWIEPLHLDRLELIDPKHNPFFEHADAAFWLAKQDGRPVGRISAQLDRLSPSEDGVTVGSFGQIAMADDPVVAAALFATAEAWLKDHGVGLVRGPFDLSINEECGLLVEGFDTPPFMLMPHNPRFLPPLVEGAGYQPVRDLFAYRMDISGGIPPAAARLADRPLGDVTLRPLRMREFDVEVRRVCAVFNDAWSDNFGFVPLTDAEMGAMAKKLRPIIDPELVRIAESGGRTIAFMVLLPNVNEAFARMNGKLLPFGWAQLAWMVLGKRIRSGRVPLMGILRDVQATALGGLLPAAMIAALAPRAIQRGMTEIEMGWVLEENAGVRRIIERMGGREAKRLRLYEKRLA
ncbi:MAG: dATP pyrophosphohydrolase [Pseudomonadota bacterium]